MSSTKSADLLSLLMGVEARELSLQVASPQRRVAGGLIWVVDGNQIQLPAVEHALVEGYISVKVEVTLTAAGKEVISTA